ncbi:MAG: GNAT family N-acetyltransferase [Rhodosalinus sp.]
MTVTLAHTPRFETERLILRAPEASDWEAAGPFLVSERARHIGGPYTGAQAWREYAQDLGHWVLRGWGLFTIEDRATGQTLGCAGPYHPEGWAENEFGWSLWRPESEGKGYAREAVERLRAYAYGELGWTTAVSYIDADNARSIALAERLGCRLDPDAPLPKADGWEDLAPGEVLVYRHPAPGKVAA